MTQVKIMMSHDPEGKMGPKMQLPDNVIVHEPKDETPMMMPPQELCKHFFCSFLQLIVVRGAVVKVFSSCHYDSLSTPCHLLHSHVVTACMVFEKLVLPCS